MTAKSDKAREKREDKMGRDNLRSVLLMNSAASINCAVYEDGPVDEEIIAACRKAAKAWSELAANLERSLAVAP
jgi:hypothetical protein